MTSLHKPIRNKPSVPEVTPARSPSRTIHTKPKYIFRIVAAVILALTLQPARSQTDEPGPWLFAGFKAMSEDGVSCAALKPSEGEKP